MAGTAPGTTVPVKVWRDGKDRTFNVKVEELDLEAENGNQQSNNAAPEGQTGGGFGITLNNVTPDVARRMDLPSGTKGAVITDVDQDSPAARSLQAGDVILQVNRQAVSNATEASQLLRAVPSGRTVSTVARGSPTARNRGSERHLGAVRDGQEAVSVRMSE